LFDYTVAVNELHYDTYIFSKPAVSQLIALIPLEWERQVLSAAPSGIADAVQ
jgi:hypothetical protein